MEEEESLNETVVDEDTKEESGHLWQKLSLLVNQMMYFLTEREQFRPQKVKQRYILSTNPLLVSSL